MEESEARARLLQGRLSCPLWQALGVGEALRLLVGRSAPVQVGDLSESEIAAGIEWGGCAVDLVDALVEAGYLYRDPVRRRLVYANGTPPPPKRIPRRGTRLPDDWSPGAAECTYAEQRQLDVDAVAEAFRDYWHSRADAGGAKLDWSATWRTWCRRSAERGQHVRRVACKAPEADAWETTSRLAVQAATQEERQALLAWLLHYRNERVRPATPTQMNDVLARWRAQGRPRVPAQEA